MYNLREDHDFQAKFASLAAKFEALELKKNDHVKSIQDISYYVYDSTKDGQWDERHVARHGHGMARARFSEARGTARHARGLCRA